MAEAHPVGFQWVMEAKARGAKVIHIDPRFTRTSALADQYVPLRVGSDIAFLGGVINYILENDLAFKEYVVAYTNAPTIVSEQFRDTDDLRRRTGRSARTTRCSARPPAGCSTRPTA
jgi:formate dehydrogenase major subunit